MVEQNDVNPKHLQQLCKELDLGIPSKDISRVYGGFHHTMWKMQTDKQCYAVKRLCPDVDPSNPNTIQHYNVAEKIANAFEQQEIHTIAALSSSDQYLQLIENTGYLVYPWTDAKAIERTQLDERHAVWVADLLCRMHTADLSIAAVKETSFETFDPSRIEQIVTPAMERGIPCAQELMNEMASIKQIIEQYNSAAEILKLHQVISHGDLDQKNILWDKNDEPLIIDWENARKLNPTYELVSVALDWSGITSDFDNELFGKMLCAYQQAGGTIHEDSITASYHRVLGDWLVWLLYLVGCLLEDRGDSQQRIEEEQVAFVWPTIMRLNNLIPNLLLTPSLSEGQKQSVEQVHR